MPFCRQNAVLAETKCFLDYYSEKHKIFLKITCCPVQEKKHEQFQN